MHSFYYSQIGNHIHSIEWLVMFGDDLEFAWVVWPEIGWVRGNPPKPPKFLYFMLPFISS